MKEFTKEEFDKLYTEWFPKIKSLGTENLRFHIMRNLYGAKILTEFRDKKNLSESLVSYDKYEKLCKDTKKDVTKNEVELKVISDNKFELYFNKSLKCEVLDYFEGKTKYFIMYNLYANNPSQTYEREIADIIANPDSKVLKIKFNPTFEEIVEKYIPTIVKKK
jgi:hypothetical protein